MKNHLLGFSDFFDEVGAVKMHTAPKKPAAGTGKPSGTTKPLRSFSSPKPTKTMRDHGKTLKRARDTALKAARLLGHAQASLSKRPPAAHAIAASTAMKSATSKATVAKHAATQAVVAPSPATKRSAVIARGAASQAILGAVAAMVQAKKPVIPAVTAGLSPKAKAAVEKHNKAIAAQKKAAQVFAKHSLVLKKSLGGLAKKMVAQKKASKLLRTPINKRGKTAVGWLTQHPAIGHEVAEALGEYYESVGAEPDPDYPGYLTDGSPDPAYASTETTDPSLDAGLTDALTEDPVDSGIEFPPAPDMYTYIPDMELAGGIPYDLSKGKPNGFVLSIGLMTQATDQDNGYGDTAQTDGTDHYGYVWGQYEKDGPEKGVRWGSELTPNSWNYIHGSRKLTAMQGWADAVTPEEAFASPLSGGPNKNGIAPSGQPFGPLIGNVNAYPQFNGMRVDAKGNMFWLPQEAPDWLTFPIKQAAALTAQAEKKAAEDAAKADAAARAKAAADAAVAQAAQDAANALAESQAASQAKIAQQEEGTKQAAEVTAQAQQETAAEQALVEQQRQETAQAASEAEQEQQAQQIIIQRAQRQEKLLADQPELEMAIMAQQSGLIEEGDEEGEGEEEEETLTDEDASDFSDESESVFDDSSAEGYTDGW